MQEIRNLQRSEIGEAGEGFDVKKQVGSSTMAHKKNPIKSENASGLSRIVRSFIIPTYENALLWHERDLANSSSERFTLSHSSILCHDIMLKSSQVLTNLWVDAERMMLNIESILLIITTTKKNSGEITRKEEDTLQQSCRC